MSNTTTSATRISPKYQIILAAWGAAEHLMDGQGTLAALGRCYPRSDRYNEAAFLSHTYSPAKLGCAHDTARVASAKALGRKRWITAAMLWDSYVAITDAVAMEGRGQ